MKLKVKKKKKPIVEPSEQEASFKAYKPSDYDKQLVMANLLRAALQVPRGELSRLSYFKIVLENVPKIEEIVSDEDKSFKKGKSK